MISIRFCTLLENPSNQTGERELCKVITHVNVKVCVDVKQIVIYDVVQHLESVCTVIRCEFNVSWHVQQ